MALDLATAGAPIVLELAARGAERIAQRHVWILVCRGTGAGAADGQGPLRQPDFDVKVVQGPVPVVTRRWRNDDVAVRDLRLELLETADQSPDARSERGRGLHVSKSHL